MILNEYVSDYFNNKEIVEPLKNPQMTNYNSLDAEINNPYDSSNSNILDFTIKGNNETEYLIKMSGIIDYTNSQFVIKKLSTKTIQDEKVDSVKRVLNSIIVNLENQYPEIDIIFWRINKNDTECIRAAYDSQFQYLDSNGFAMEFAYYLKTSSVRQNYNTRKLSHRVSEINDYD